MQDKETRYAPDTAADTGDDGTADETEATTDIEAIENPDDFDPHTDRPHPATALDTETSEHPSPSTPERQDPDPASEEVADTTGPDPLADAVPPDLPNSEADVACVPNAPEQIDGELPFIYNRDDTTTDRSILSVYGADQTTAKMTDIEQAFSDHFEEDVSALDVREALLIAGMHHVDTAGKVLKLWGYGLRS